MYSYEDRIQAVKLYLKLGKRIRATIRQLGYPTKKNSLNAWHREHKQCHELRTGCVRAAPGYSAEEKQAAVDYYLSHDRCAATTLKVLGHRVVGRLPNGSKNCAPRSESVLSAEWLAAFRNRARQAGGGH